MLNRWNFLKTGFYEGIRLALRYLGDKGKDEFLGEPQLQDAVVRRLEIIGETAARVSDETRSELAQIPW